MNGLMRPIPKLWSIDNSCLMGCRTSVLRNEMTIFKAILRENLPHVCDKLRQMGLPVEYLIYNSIASLYANMFQSEIVFRIWDVIIFNLSAPNKNDRKRALWYIMCPAFLIFREKQEEIMRCTTVLQIIESFNNAGSVSYDPDWVINELKAMNKEIFVYGAERFTNTTGGDPETGGTFSLSKFNTYLSKQTNAMMQVDKARMLE
mmetsp:Transcript_14990/g.14567  ORF Transcript_14990/g.14567 Transcript_14990/m.14567 type:complete len:204 (+) Transcript_14990:180-791(+)